MNLLAVLARAPILFDLNVGLSITSLLGSLGAAGAAVTVTHYFVGFLKKQETGRARIVAEFKGFHAESQKNFQDQLERLSNRQVENQQDFQDQIARMTERQTEVLHDAIVTIKGMENTIDGSSRTLQGVQKSIGSFRLTVSTIDILLCDTAQK
jgi:flagellar hook-basal body complex protein FliE